MSKKDTALEIVSKVSGKDIEELTPETELVANLGMDSAKALELLVELEDELGIEIPDEAAASLNTVGDVITYIESI